MAGMLEKAALQGGINTFTAGVNGLIGYLSARKIANINYKLNEKAAENADARARALYRDYESPMATIRQLKEAGLSPSLYAGGNLGGGMGVNAAQGQGASGMGAISGMMSPIDIAGIEVQEAQARKLNAEADELEGKNLMGKAKVMQILADANLKVAQETYTKAETAQTKLETQITDESKPFILAKVENEAEIYKNNANKTFWEAEDAQIEWNLKVETFESEVEIKAAQVAELAARAAYENSGAKLNDEERKHIQDFAHAQMMNATAHADSAASYGTYVKNMKDIAIKELEQRKDELHVEKWRIGVNAAVDVLQGAMHMIGMRFFGGGGTTESVVEKTKFDKYGYPHADSTTRTTRKRGGK